MRIMVVGYPHLNVLQADVQACYVLLNTVYILLIKPPLSRRSGRSGGGGRSRTPRGVHSRRTQPASIPLTLDNIFTNCD